MDLAYSLNRIEMPIRNKAFRFERINASKNRKIGIRIQKNKINPLQQIRRPSDGFIEVPLRNTKCVEEQ